MNDAVHVATLRAAGCVFAEDEYALIRDAADSNTSLIEQMIDRRAGGEPLEQVVGFADFCEVRVSLVPGVFVPRMRSELLVGVGEQEVRARTNPTVVDLCCGSGALAMALAARVPGTTMHAADSDPVATACATANLTGIAAVHTGDLFDALPKDLRGHLDVLIANVPYVATADIPFLPPEARDHEPHATLDGGPDGLDVLRRIATGTRDWLAPGGVLLSEIATHQHESALALMRDVQLETSLVIDDDLEATVVRGVCCRA